MNDLTASIGLVQLDKLPQSNGRRKEIVAIYCREFAGIPEVELPAPDSHVFQSAWHLFHIKCAARDDLSLFLSQNGIATSVHYSPLHTYRCYSDHPRLPNAEALQHRLLTLPLYPDLSDDEVALVTAKIRQFYRGRRKKC